jgi:peroxiredoxin
MFGITRDRVSALRAHAEKHDLGFVLLSDPTGDISAIYGSFDSGANQTRPGYVLIDRRGVVKLSVIGQTFPPEQVLTLVTLTIQAQ